MVHALVIAGLSAELFDRVKQISGKTLAPDGLPIISPLPAHSRYDSKYIQKLITATYGYAKQRNETEPFSTLLLYVDYKDQSTSDLLATFFPFSLAYPLPAPDFSQARTRPQIRNVLNEFAKQVTEAAIELRRIARTVSEFTNVQNLTPLLLPLRNFASVKLRSILDDLYGNLPRVADRKPYIESVVKSFIADHPRVRPPGQDRHCFSDGRLFFKSPGRDRHGHFRNAAADNHAMICLLNARSRIGGHYPADFHYDCVPVRNGLASDYPNCHAMRTAPGRATHVNISPNDFVR
ncbi:MULTISPECIES: hypothetical protein [unclassified Bradyrhizobium]|uniref:hypothetical protein n=1 Tax=unclassified Bradyrhizobium TaxID=2631580 RepID=UPI0028E3BB0F|nr:MULTISPECIES: hypothetical protein [unclassified Bradyrhizobium]